MIFLVELKALVGTVHEFTTKWTDFTIDCLIIAIPAMALHIVVCICFNL